MAFVDSAGTAQGGPGSGGAPTGGGGAAVPSTPSSGQPGANGPGSSMSQSRWIVAFILADLALLVLIGYVFKGRNY